MKALLLVRQQKMHFGKKVCFLMEEALDYYKMLSICSSNMQFTTRSLCIQFWDWKLALGFFHTVSFLLLRNATTLIFQARLLALRPHNLISLMPLQFFWHLKNEWKAFDPFPATEALNMHSLTRYWHNDCAPSILLHWPASQEYKLSLENCGHTGHDLAICYMHKQLPLVK